MSDNILIHDDNSPEQVKTLPGCFPLDWQTQEVKFGGGKFTHTLRRPTTAELFDRERDIQTEIPIAKDGSYSLPDPTADEETDAKFYDKVVVETRGYTDEVPTMHKAAAFRGLYKREVYVDDDSDVLGGQVSVIEEVGNGDEPDFTIRHLLRQPTEDELRRYRRSSTGGTLKPDKRGRQKFVTKSSLKTAVEFYDLWVLQINGATVEGRECIGDTHGFIDMVDPLIKRMVVQAFFAGVSEALSD